MEKIITDEARMAFEITQWYINKGYDLNDSLVLSLTHIKNDKFREEFNNFPYKKLESYNITNIDDKIEKFIQNINTDIVTLKDIFNNIEEKDKILKKYKINYKISIKTTSNFTDIDSLLQYGYDLVQKAEENLLEPVIGRTEEIGRIIHILSRKIKNNSLLVGEPGTGKSAIVEAVAQKIAKKEASSLNNKKIIALDLNSIVAGTKYRGDFEQRMQEIVETLLKNPDIILFIDEIHSLVGRSGQEYGNILKPYLSRGEIQVIGATTNKEYREIFQKEKALDRRFQSLMIIEPTEEETFEIINKISNIYENWHNVKLNDNILKEIVSLTGRYMSYRNFPDKAIDILDELCSFHKSRIEKPKEINEQENKIDNIRKSMSKEIFVEQYKFYIDILKEEKNLKELYINFNKLKNSRKVLNIEDLYNVFYRVTGIPVGNIKTKEKEMLMNLEDNLNKKVIGQNKAVNNISKSIIRSKLGYTRLNKPIASFLLVGDSGIGKTLCSKELANILFSEQQKSYKRFDMSEYVEPHSVSNLIGSPPGYVNSDEGGQLTNFGRENPYSIILFDEIEKAHETIENIMLQLLDNGTVTDKRGETTNFSNSIIMYTSNCITEFKEKGSFGFNSNEKNENSKNNALFKELCKHFKQEFLNRIDYIIMFNNLDDKCLENIINLEINKLSNEYLTKLNIKINNNVKQFIMSKLQRKNARYITKTIQNEIIDPLINKSLKEEIDVSKLVIVNLQKNKLRFKN